MKYPAIDTEFMDGETPIMDNDRKTIARLVDFWSWAHSDINGNTERGILAEYLVACAIGMNNNIRVNFDSFDLITPEGITLEVKSSGYIQTWGQENLSKITFGIQPTAGWDKTTNTYKNEKMRQAQVYVFCVLKHKEQQSINPLNIVQWDFYLLPTSTLNEKVKMQKNISLSSLLKLCAKQTTYETMHENIIKLMK